MRITRRILRQYKRGGDEEGELLNLVPFIDILTILVIYLLVGAVSPHLAALDLNLPSSQVASAAPKKPPLQLTLSLKRDGFVINDSSGRAQRIDKKGADYDLKTLGQLLAQIKRQHGDETSATLLLEPEIPYDLLVQVMDTARLMPVQGPDETATEMFPDISIGDAGK